MTKIEFDDFVINYIYNIHYDNNYRIQFISSYDQNCQIRLI